MVVVVIREVLGFSSSFFFQVRSGLFLSLILYILAPYDAMPCHAMQCYIFGCGYGYGPCLARDEAERRTFTFGCAGWILDGDGGNIYLDSPR